MHTHEVAGRQAHSHRPYILNSVTGSGHIKYKKNPLACKLHDNSTVAANS